MTDTTFGVPNEFIKDCINDEDLENSVDLLISECANTIIACQKLKRSYQTSRPEIIKSGQGRLKSQVARQLTSLAILAHFQQIKEGDIALEVDKF